MDRNIFLAPLLCLLATVAPSHAAAIFPMLRSDSAYAHNAPSHAAPIYYENEQPPTSYLFPRSTSPRASPVSVVTGLAVGITFGVIFLFCVGILIRMAITRRRRKEAVQKAVEASQARDPSAQASGAAMVELEANGPYTEATHQGPANGAHNQATYQGPANGRFQAASNERHEAPQNERYELE